MIVVVSEEELVQGEESSKALLRLDLFSLLLLDLDAAPLPFHYLASAVGENNDP